MAHFFRENLLSSIAYLNIYDGFHDRCLKSQTRPQFSRFEMPQDKFMRSIALSGKKVIPLARDMLAWRGAR
jgi:hypothetical protein